MKTRTCTSRKWRKSLASTALPHFHHHQFISRSHSKNTNENTITSHRGKIIGFTNRKIESCWLHTGANNMRFECLIIIIIFKKKKGENSNSKQHEACSYNMQNSKSTTNHRKVNKNPNK